MIKNLIVVGLGNPGEEYENTRHNIGRKVLDLFNKSHELDDWEIDKKLKALVAEGKVGKNRVLLVKPETFMNKSGESVKPLIKTKKAAESLIVIHDDLDLPLGKIKISFNKSSGGHRGVESIIKAIKTESFVRIRIGISAETASGKIKKPQGEQKVIDAILGDFKKSEELDVKKIVKRSVIALEKVIQDGWSVAASQLGNL
jgi:PTH1 family peptidyl-tRNA hydrolase